MHLLPVSLLFATTACAAWSHVSEAIFREALDANDLNLIAFVAPKSESAKALEVEWATVQEAGPNVLSIDCIDEARLCADLDVVSFPAIRLYGRNGDWMRRYRGPKKANPITAFLKRAANRDVTDLEEAAMDEYKSSDDVVFVAHLGSQDTVNLEERFRDEASRYADRYSFGLISTSSTSEVKCFNNREDFHYTVPEADFASPAAIDIFIQKCAAPLVPQMTRRNEMEVLSTGKSIVYFFSPFEQDRTVYTDSVRPLARKYGEFLTFVTVDSASYPEMVAGLGLSGGTAGTGLSVQNPRMGQVFPFPATKPVASDVVEKFIVAISEGKVTPWDGQMEEGRWHDEL